MLEKLPRGAGWVDLTQVASITHTVPSTGIQRIEITTRQGVKHEADFSLFHEAREFSDAFGQRAMEAQEAQASTLERLGDNLQANAAAAATTLRDAATSGFENAKGFLGRLRGGPDKGST